MARILQAMKAKTTMGQVIAMPKSDHPLWTRWLVLRRRDVLCAEWRDFRTFVAGVSPKPDNAKKLARPDASAPYGPTNFAWMITPTREAELAYLKAWRERNPDHRRARRFMTEYGITIDQFDAMLEAQGGGCAICGQPEKVRHRVAKGDVRRLAVDHDHDTGSPRALLCGDCNRGLGMFGDDAARLVAAASYILAHRRLRRVA